jgi:hypothetical protein
MAREAILDQGSEYYDEYKGIFVTQELKYNPSK